MVRLIKKGKGKGNKQGKGNTKRVIKKGQG